MPRSVLLLISLCTTVMLPGMNTLTETHPLQRELFVERLQKESGFPLSKVLRIFQDRNGMIWFCGTNGIARYDGEKYRVYSQKPGSEYYLPSGWVESIEQDDNGNIWIGTAQGLFYLNKEGEFTPVTFDFPNNVKVLKKEITSLYFDHLTRTLFYSSYYGLHALQLNTGRKKFYYFFGNRDDYHKITDIVRAPDGHIYFVALYDGVHKLDESRMQSVRMKFYANGTYIPDIQATRLKIGFSNQLWLGTWGDGLLEVKKVEGDRFDIDMYKWYTNSGDRYMHNIINQLCFFKDLDGREMLAIATEDNGLKWMDLKSRQITTYFHDPGNPHSIPDNTITNALFKDDVLWLGTFNGAAKIALHKQQFSPVQLKYTGSKLFNAAQKVNVTDVAQDSDEEQVFWITTAEGALGKMDLSKNVLRWYYLNILLKNPNQIILNTLTDVQNTKILIGYNHGLVWFDKVSERFVPFQNKSDPVKNSSVISIEQWGVDDYLVTAFGRGVYTFNASRNQFANLNGSAISETRFRFCKAVSNGRLLMTTMSDGFYLYDTTLHKYYKYNVREKGKFHYPFTGLYNFTEDRLGNIWLASSDGLSILQSETDRVKKYKMRNGFPDDWILKVEAGIDGHVWILTRNGLGRVNPESRYPQVFRYRQGFFDLQLLDMNQTADGSLWISSFDRVYRIQPGQFKYPAKHPQLYLVSMAVNGKKLGSPVFTFDHYDHLIEWSFSSVYTIDPENISYYIQLAGKKDTIEYLNNSLQLSLLPPGHYKIKAWTRHNNHLQVSAPLEMSFTIRPPWYERNSFYLLLVLTISFIIWSVFYFRTRSLKKENALKLENSRKISELEMKTLRAQINPHFIFNSLNSIQKFILSNDVLKASDFLGKFSRMIRMVLENSIENNTSLEMEEKLLVHYLDLEKLRSSDKFNYQIEIHPDLDKNMFIPSMLAQPYLENAIWHGISPKEGPGLIQIRFLPHSSGLLCEITDDGIGREESARNRINQHKSRGLSITEQRLKLAFPQLRNPIKVSDILDSKNRVCGTKVEIIVPVYGS